jgi:hypothetical protein
LFETDHIGFDFIHIRVDGFDRVLLAGGKESVNIHVCKFEALAAFAVVSSANIKP